MNREQIASAARHDWFISATASGVVMVVERASLSGHLLPDEFLTFTDFRALRAWAGY
jgi:hypothetical protein